jgi:hypothetical protein
VKRNTGLRIKRGLPTQLGQTRCNRLSGRLAGIFIFLALLKSTALIMDFLRLHIFYSPFCKVLF